MGSSNIVNVILEESVRDEFINPGKVDSFVGLLIGTYTENGSYCVAHKATTSEEVDDSVDTNKYGCSAPSEGSNTACSYPPPHPIATILTLTPQRMADHAKKVIRMLPGGFHILGFYVIEKCDDLFIQKYEWVLLSFYVHLLKGRSSNPFYASSFGDKNEKLIFHFNPSTNQFNCKVMAENNSLSSKSVKISFDLMQWQLANLECDYDISTDITLFKKDIGQSLKKNLNVLLKSFKKGLRSTHFVVKEWRHSSDTSFDEIQVENNVWPSFSMELGRENSNLKNIKETHIQMVEKLPAALIDGEAKSISGTEYVKRIQIKGKITGVVFARKGCSSTRIVEILRQDILRSMTCRMEMLCESLIDKETDTATGTEANEQDYFQVCHEVPKTAVANWGWRSSGLDVRDYLYPKDWAKDSRVKIELFVDVRSRDNRKEQAFTANENERFETDTKLKLAEVIIELNNALSRRTMELENGRLDISVQPTTQKRVLSIISMIEEKMRKQDEETVKKMDEEWERASKKIQKLNLEYQQYLKEERQRELELKLFGMLSGSEDNPPPQPNILKRRRPQKNPKRRKAEQKRRIHEPEHLIKKEPNLPSYFPIRQKDMLIEVVKTTISSEIFTNSNRQILAEIAVNAVLSVANVETGDVDLEMIKVEGKSGGKIEDTMMVKGIIIDKEFSHSQMPKVLEDVKIALVTAPIKPLTEFDVRRTKVLKDYYKRDHDKLNEMVQKVKEAGATLAFCQWGFAEEEVNKLFLHHNLSAVRWVTKEDMERIAVVTGSIKVVSLEKLNGLRFKLGKAGRVREVEFVSTKERMLVIEDCENSKVVTIMVRGSNEMVVDEVKLYFHEALLVVKKLIWDTRVMAGGDISEVLFSLQIKTEDDDEVSPALQRMEAFFRCVSETMGKVLAENLNSIPIQNLDHECF